MRKLLITSILGLLLLPVLAQKSRTSAKSSANSTTVESNASWMPYFKNLKPRNIGPAGMSGRVTTIDAVWDNPNTVWIGSASGGVFKSTNAGTTWTPVFDDQPTLNIGAIAIQQNNPNTVWVGTGEGNPRNSLNIGEGIFKTTDGGKSWKRMGLEKTRNIHRILIDPLNPNTVYAGVIGNPYAEHPERGVFKTTDGGITWNKILYTNDTSGIGDMVMDPSDPNHIIAAMWQHRRTPWSLKSGGPGSGLYITNDGGSTWKKLGKENGLPDGDFGRIGVDFSRSNPNIVYAMVEANKNGLYKSTDGGYTWTLVNSDPRWVTNRPFYFQDIKVDPVNENRIYNIYQYISVSEDGGKTFVQPRDVRIHVDHHALWIHPKNANMLLNGNDGGLALSLDRGETWQMFDNLDIGQFYHINVDDQMPYHVMGGMQDNGSWRGPAYTWESGGIRTHHWDDLAGGDGFDVVPDPEDNNWVYAMSQRGFVGRGNVNTGQRDFIQPPSLDPDVRLRYNWNAAIALDPFDPKTVYFGSQFLHKSPNKGLNWEIISPDLTTNNPLHQSGQDENGGLSIDITGAETYNSILAIEPSRLARNVLWIGTDDGNVQLTQDGGKSWTNFRGKIPGMPQDAWIPQIRASRYNAGEALVVGNNYRQGDFETYVFRTTDYGKTWKRIASGAQVRGYALCVLQDPVQPNLIFLGTEHGLWISFNNGTSWEQFKNGYPNVSTYDLAIQERESSLAIATFGRSLWVLDDIKPLREAASNVNAYAKTLKVLPASEAVQASRRGDRGTNSPGFSVFEGANKPGGAAVSFWYKPLTGKDTLKSKRGTDSAWVRIYNDKNEFVRSLKAKADTGINTFYWGFDTKGIRQPGQPKPQPGRPEPGGGLPAPPGTYKVVVSVGDEKDSTLLTVKTDPRYPYSNEVYEGKKALSNRLQTSTNALTKVADQITDAEETLKKVEASFKDMDPKQAESLKKQHKAMSDSVKVLREMIFGKQREKQGYGNPYSINATNQLRTAGMSIMSKNKVPDVQEQTLVKNAESFTANVVQRSNAFFNGPWQEFRKAYEAVPVSPFKDVKQ